MDDFRAIARNRLAALITADEDGFAAAVAEALHPDAVFDVAWPVNRLEGADAIAESFLRPLRTALTGAHRRDLLFIGGRNNRAEEGMWCAAVTHYAGNFDADLFGVPPGQSLAFLRSGEFYRVEDGKIVEAKIIFDLPDLLRQVGRMPLPSLGTEITFPAPATQDGLLPQTGDGAASLNLIEAMLGDLHDFDPATGNSPKQTGEGGYWHENMLWYGPAGVGSNFRWEGFVKDHRAEFLRAFPDRKGGNHYCRFGDGDYAAVSGWPSMTMSHRHTYLGVPATDKTLTLRVMDFYRCADGQIMENWVTLDYGDLFMQMGVDLIERARNMPPAADPHRL